MKTLLSILTTALIVATINLAYRDYKLEKAYKIHTASHDQFAFLDTCKKRAEYGYHWDEGTNNCSFSSEFYLNLDY